MERIIKNAAGTLRLDRETYQRILWDDYATADAVLIVVLVAAIRLVGAVLLGRLSALGLINGMLQLTVSELVRWMVAALVLWVVSTKLLGGSGRIPPTVGLTGYAYLPFVFAPLVKLGFGLGGLGPLGAFVDIAASLWFGLGLWLIAGVLFDLPRDRAGMAAVLAVVGWWIVQAII